MLDISMFDTLLGGFKSRILSGLFVLGFGVYVNENNRYYGMMCIFRKQS